MNINFKLISKEKEKQKITVDLNNPQYSLNIDNCLHGHQETIKNFTNFLYLLHKAILKPNYRDALGPRYKKKLSLITNLVYNTPNLELNFKDLCNLLLEKYKQLSIPKDKIIGHIQNPDQKNFWSNEFFPQKIKHGIEGLLLQKKLANFLLDEKSFKLFTRGLEDVSIDTDSTIYFKLN